MVIDYCGLQKLSRYHHGEKIKPKTKKKPQRKDGIALPGSPRQHDLKRESTREVEHKLPNRWPSQPFEDDYGKDLLVEINEGGHATGLEFRIQVKGQEHFDIVNSNYVAQPLKISTLNYFEQTILPMLLVVYSARDRRAHYLWVKSYIQDTLNVKQPNWREQDGESEITLHVPLANVFGEVCHQDILEHVDTETAKLRMQAVNVQGTISNSSPRPRLNSFATSHRLIRPNISQHIHRSRLTTKIADALRTGSVFIHTDAGYGKSWLIYDFISTITPKLLVWYTFYGDVITPLQFIEEIASEFARQTNKVGLTTLTYLNERRGEAKLDEALGILIKEFQSAEERLLLIVEDLHLLTDSDIALLFESLLVIHATNLQIIVTSRLPLPMGQARLIAQGLLTIIDSSDLVFQLDETREFLQDRLNLNVDDEQIKYLQARTSGWIAALALATDALREKSADVFKDLFQRLTGFSGNIYDFFAEEVYAGLGVESRTLLKRLSLVRVVAPPTVNLFTKRNDGGQILRDLHRHNTFLIKNSADAESYSLHSLFAEFLQTRFRDEEGNEIVQDAQRSLAYYFVGRRDHFYAIDHALAAQEYDLAAHELEIVTPTAVNMGYGQPALVMIERLPEERLEHSAVLLEVKGRAALQVGEINLALESLSKAQTLYEANEDEKPLIRVEYLLAEAQLANGSLESEPFVRTAYRLAKKSYEQNEVMIGAQIELRMIEVGQTISMQYSNLLQELIERSEALIKRLEQFNGEYTLIKAKALADLAHLSYQIFVLGYEDSLYKIRVREDTHHPLSKEERIQMARPVVEVLGYVFDLYEKAEALVKDNNEIEKAHIRLRRLRDRVHHLSFTPFIGKKLGLAKDSAPDNDEATKLIRSSLSIVQECVDVFAKYGMATSLASAYCDAAEIFDILGDTENRNKLAQEALNIANQKGLTTLAQQAERLLRNQFTFSWLREQTASEPDDKNLASLDDAGKKHFVESYLRVYAGDTNIDAMRKSLEVDVNDMVAAAKQRVEWCQHVEIIQDLQHTRSLQTMHREIPPKWIVCSLLKYRSTNRGFSFDELWPLFRGVYCLGCSKRSPAK